MSFYPQQHNPYCGLALQARSMYVGSRDHAGTLLVPKKVAATPAACLRLVAP